MKLKRFYLVFLPVVFSLFFLSCFYPVFAESQEKAEPKIAGKLFGVEVPAGNYYFAKRAVITFGAKWRGTPRDEKELEDLVWQELLFSYEAFRQEISATPEEIDEEIEKLLQANKVEFKWRVDKEEYQKWTKETLNMDIETFHNQLEHLVKLEKLRKNTLESTDPEVSEEEAYQKFLDEYNTLMVELKQFDELKDAQDFYEKSIKPVSQKETEALIWNDLLLSFEAAKRGIKVQEDESENEIVRLLRDDEARFKWKEETDKYEEWVKNRFGLSGDTFKNKITQLLAVDNLRLKMISKEEPQMQDTEKFSQFLEKNKKIAIAYSFFFDAFAKDTEGILRFKDMKEAKDFYNNANRTAGFWEDEKRNDPKSFKVPGFVALDFLINLWGFQREDAYKMLEKEIGTFYPPAPIYKGYGVFKVLKIRKAEPEEFEKRRENYFGKVKQIKQYELYKQWVEELKQKAEIERYIK